MYLTWPPVLNNINPFQNKPWFLCVCSTGLLKTLWEKEKLLVTSNFFFSHSVFYLFRELTAIFIKFEIIVLSGKGLNFTHASDIRFKHRDSYNDTLFLIDTYSLKSTPQLAHISFMTVGCVQPSKVNIISLEQKKNHFFHDSGMCTTLQGKYYISGKKNIFSPWTDCG